MSKTGTPVKIYCLNLRCGYIRDERDGRDNMIRTRQHRVNKQIKQMDPDVIALQECTSGWLALLEDGILDDYTIVNKWRCNGLSLIPGSTDVESCPVAYKTAKYEELDRGWFWLSDTPDVATPSYEDPSYRIVTWVRLKDKQTGAEFYFASTHFPLGEGYSNVMAGRQCARWFDALPQGSNAFIMGDLNAPYRGYCYSGFAYEPGFKNLYDTCKAMEADGKCKIGEVKKTYNAFRYPAGCNFIDHIFIKPNPSLAVDYYTVLYDMVGVPEKNIPVGYVSDHFATYTEVRIDTEEDNAKYMTYGKEAEDRLPENREDWGTRADWMKARGM